MASLAETSLCKRLGDHQVVTNIIDDVYNRLLRHHQTWYYWKGCSTDGKTAEQRRFTELVCASAGGLATDQDDKMKPALEGLGISKVKLGVFVELAANSLIQSKLSERDKEELFLVLVRSKAAITVVQEASSPTAGFAGYAPRLTDREIEVLRLLALGKSNSEIAQELFISINTVTRHVTNIFLKTDTKNRVEAAVYAVRHSIL